ncbi:hypothetical protein [Duganella callida]|uniref:Uncharacterized protein n=1 Tax=Duganella callida TaxID=2561932 RepID=A0A4Y9SYY7_9BURK|nr:hypothetical protein [Duganella callida]TFW29946.1 hypothetical protein E4L98_03035 [Duganella callida]
MKTLLSLALLAAVCHAGAQNAPSVTVSTTRDPVDKSYRKMVAGMDLFERRHALAPQASLRFQLLPRLPTTELDGIALRVAGDTVSLPVTVAADHSFTLERNAQALKEDAALIASRKTSTLTWRAQVRSPGVPDGMRRLGDLRLECMVGVEAGLLSNNAQMFAWLGELFTSPERVCNAPDGNYLFFADHPVFAVTLRDGARGATLPFSALYAGGTQTPATLPYCDCQVLLDRSYYAPVWDRGWSDDTLLSFEDMAAPGGTALAPDYASTAQMRARLGPAQVIAFDSGYQVWRYNYPAAHGQPAPAEFVVLFGPDGQARKARMREPDQP